MPATDCRRFALSQPISTLVCGIRSRENLRQDLDIARKFQPMTEAETAKLLAGTKTAGAEGAHERFKTTIHFNGPYHRQQHGET